MCVQRVGVDIVVAEARNAEGVGRLSLNPRRGSPNQLIVTNRKSFFVVDVPVQLWEEEVLVARPRHSTGETRQERDSRSDLHVRNASTTERSGLRRGQNQRVR